jgi:hypothetical protein
VESANYASGRARAGRLSTSGPRMLGRRIGVTIVAFAAAAVLPPAVAGQAVSRAAAPEESLAKLEKRADALAKEFRGEIANLDDARRSAKTADVRAERLAVALTETRAKVRDMATTAYMHGGVDAAAVVAGSDPGSAVEGMTAVEYLARDNDRRMQELAQLSERANTANRAARDKVTEVRAIVEDLEKQRAKVKKLLAKFRPEKPAAAARPDAASGGGKSPIIGDNVTPRMRALRDEVDRKFGPFPAIGCFRAGDSGEHGKGRACDFMESTGGRMPSASAQAHGDRVAQYVIDNRSRLGLMYVIWKQRIWDTRTSGGWRAMEDRGSITANHFDHVHVSVL